MTEDPSATRCADCSLRSDVGLATTLILSLALSACGPSEPADANEATMADDAEAVVETPESSLSSADTTADAVCAHLEDVSYAGRWDAWPGTEPLYQGREPHGALLTTYVDNGALEGLAAMSRGTQDAMPLGAVIVKENHRPDSTLASVTVMYKAEGYDPEHGNWFWMKRLPDGTVPASGRVQSCIDCHEEGPDYLMADPGGSHTEM